ncbi:hypothetical protein ACIBK8_29500 [Streptomyces sp. NPDC050161]|uniref:hypothetical protein n=1 Tax=Streptomyces sp. NPDC050161 TaxID=3365604 RepID=UPI00379B492F
MYRGFSKFDATFRYLAVGLALLLVSFALPYGFLRGVACGAGVVLALAAAVRMGRRGTKSE